MSYGPVVMVYISEILPDRGISFAVMLNWLACILCITVFNFLPESSYFFIILAVACALGLIIVLKYMKETKGKSKAEIVNMFVRNTSTNYQKM